MKFFATIENRISSDGNLAINLAWFHAVAGQKDAFYQALERALKLARLNTLVWIDQEVDIDAYRDDERFKTLVAKYGAQ